MVMAKFDGGPRAGELEQVDGNPMSIAVMRLLVPDDDMYETRWQTGTYRRGDPMGDGTTLYAWDGWN